jgi:hypothetical protein
VVSRAIWANIVGEFLMKISMKKRLLLSLLVIQLAACDSSPSSPEDGPPDGVIPPISDAALLSHLNFFAADSLYGRRAGSEHERRSAEYIRDRFIEMDLEPGAPSYFQEFTITVPVDGRTGLVSQNVLGILRGQGSLAGQWVILGAHYDHVGYSRGLQRGRRQRIRHLADAGGRWPSGRVLF